MLHNSDPIQNESNKISDSSKVIQSEIRPLIESENQNALDMEKRKKLLTQQLIDIKTGKRPTNLDDPNLLLIPADYYGQKKRKKISIDITKDTIKFLDSIAYDLDLNKVQIITTQNKATIIQRYLQNTSKHVVMILLEPTNKLLSCVSDVEEKNSNNHLLNEEFTLNFDLINQEIINSNRFFEGNKKSKLHLTPINKKQKRSLDLELENAPNKKTKLEEIVILKKELFELENDNQSLAANFILLQSELNQLIFVRNTLINKLFFYTKQIPFKIVSDFTPKDFYPNKNTLLKSKITEHARKIQLVDITNGLRPINLEKQTQFLVELSYYQSHVSKKLLDDLDNNCIKNISDAIAYDFNLNLSVKITSETLPIINRLYVVQKNQPINVILLKADYLNNFLFESRSAHISKDVLNNILKEIKDKNIQLSSTLISLDAALKQIKIDIKKLEVDVYKFELRAIEQQENKYYIVNNMHSEPRQLFGFFNHNTSTANKIVDQQVKNNYKQK